MNRLRGSGGTANFRRMPPPCYDGEENYRDWSLRGSSTKSITERNCIAVWRKRRFKISIPFPPSLSALFRRDYIAMIVSINPWFLPFFYFNSTRRWFDAYKIRVYKSEFPDFSAVPRIFQRSRCKTSMVRESNSARLWGTGEGPSFLFERNFPCRHLRACNRRYTTDHL